MKLVGGDSGRVEHEEFVDEVVLAPSERAVVDVLFDAPERFALEHRTPERTYTLARSPSARSGRQPSLDEAFDTLRTDPELDRGARADRALVDGRARQVLAFVAEMDVRGRPRARSSTCARCTRRSSRPSRAAARCAA